MLTITVNGIRREIQAPDDTPLLYVLRNDLELTGPQFGCGLAQCGACSVLIEGKEVRSCVTPISIRREPGNHLARGSAREMGKANGPVGGGRAEHPAPGPAGMDQKNLFKKKIKNIGR